MRATFRLRSDGSCILKNEDRKVQGDWLQAKHEMSVAGESVQLGDNQHWQRTDAGRRSGPSWAGENLSGRAR
jgi:hypothetical protein